MQRRDFLLGAAAPLLAAPPDAPEIPKYRIVSPFRGGRDLFSSLPPPKVV